MPLGKRALPTLLCALAALRVGACASSQWPDQTGKPVPPSRAANVDTADQFLAALTDARQQRSLPEPVVTPAYQSEIRKFAQDLQAGRTSAPGAQRAIETWGRITYQGPVQTWLLDCGGGGRLQIPPQLINSPSAVVSYAAARFRPPAATTDQCAVLVVARKP